MPMHERGIAQTNTEELGIIAKRQFVVAAINMSWQLVVVILVPIIGGVELDKALKSKSLYLYVGLGVALAGMVLVLWQAMRTANRLPVPELTAAQKKAIQKSYEAEDDD
jgi:F0F1-type ATP synthase assembly protein I